MIKILVLSDSHGNINLLKSIMAVEGDADYIVHCGDGAADLLHCGIPENKAVIRVSGNVDRYSSPGLDEIYEFTVSGFNFLLIHGDRYNVKESLDKLKKFSAAINVHVVFFGHTHIKAFIEGDTVLFNPGPATLGCYGIVTINGSLKFRHLNIRHQAE